MMITMGIVDEKTDNSIKASNVTPLTRISYVIGKSLMGIFTLLVTAFISLLILGFWNVNWLQMLTVLFSASPLEYGYRVCAGGGEQRFYGSCRGR